MTDLVMSSSSGMDVNDATMIWRMKMTAPKRRSNLEITQHVSNRESMVKMPTEHVLYTAFTRHAISTNRAISGFMTALSSSRRWLGENAVKTGLPPMRYKNDSRQKGEQHAKLQPKHIFPINPKSKLSTALYTPLPTARHPRIQ
ncbi:hypothetical protein ACRALDRAFT_2020351 [Sodiomyces alcalophilus JCM 7366]|uniref:uncharacterized protein n=1 Tax=Sodiomyces alcalophilus JCM 7366 TaxID=591952 RepID=UPI0039B5FF3B